MRLTFFVLLAVNLLFLAWARWIDTPPAGPRDTASHLPSLKLVGEPPAPATPSPKSSATISGAAQKIAAQGAGAVSLPAQSLPAISEQAGVTSCLSVGPFNEIAAAARIAAVLRDRGFRPQQRAEEGETLEGFWVYVGGMRSDIDVTHALQSLEKNGFTDAHVMKESSEGRRISVGLFSERTRAEARAAAVRKMGFEPLIAERKFPGTVYWVDVSLQPGMTTLPTQGLLSDGEHVKVGMQSCPPGPGAKPVVATARQDD